jgi:hypothetical protein
MRKNLVIRLPFYYFFEYLKVNIKTMLFVWRNARARKTNSTQAAQTDALRYGDMEI